MPTKNKSRSSPYLAGRAASVFGFFTLATYVGLAPFRGMAPPQEAILIPVQSSARLSILLWCVHLIFVSIGQAKNARRHLEWAQFAFAAFVGAHTAHLVYIFETLVVWDVSAKYGGAEHIPGLVLGTTVYVLIYISMLRMLIYQWMVLSATPIDIIRNSLAALFALLALLRGAITGGGTDYWILFCLVGASFGFYSLPFWRAIWKSLRAITGRMTHFVLQMVSNVHRNRSRH